MSLGDLDENLTPPKRLAAMGLLASARRVEFSYLRDQLQLTDSDLSKQLKVLVDAGYLTSKRTGKGLTRASWFSITRDGRRALENHAAALRRLLDPAPPPAPRSNSLFPAVLDADGALGSSNG